MPESLARYEHFDDVAYVTLSRPQKRNALSRDLIAQLTDAVTRASSDPGVRLLVLAAEGSVFCAGMDLAEMQFRAAQPNARELWQGDTQAYRDLLVALLTAPMPMLAAVQGPAVAGGVGLVAACDLVLAADAATFALPEPQRGITAAIVAPLLVHRVGPGPAGYLLLSGRGWTAGEAQRAGLCHEVCPADEFAERRDDLIGSVLRGGPSALRLTKRHLHETAGRHLVGEIDAAMQLSAEAREGDEARDGLAAFLERRSPAWFPGGSDRSAASASNPDR